MATMMRISVLRKSSIRSPSLSFSRFCTSNSNDGTVTGPATGAVTGGNSSPPSSDGKLYLFKNKPTALKPLIHDHYALFDG
jgi:hypothetical protein